ncbi:MAG: hypothetical protein HOE90_04775 [Bacteriovoracaceae bacterium]|jgi:hypothetical protein|nr:hypothetical protein [Bacteriovoracaceae bacterium]
MFKYLLPLYCLIGSGPSFAGWTQSEVEHIASYKSPFKNPYMATIHNGCKRKKPKSIDNLLIEEHAKIETEEFKSGFINYSKALQIDSDGNFRKSPVVVFLPGIFTNYDDLYVKNLINHFGSTGHHVLTFPNPFGSYYLLAKPKHTLPDVEAQAEVLYTLIRKTLQSLKEKDLLYPGRVRLFGVSHGAYLSALIGARDLVDENPIKFYDTVLISPPAHMGTAIKRLDQMMDETASKKKVKSYLLGFKLCQFKKESKRYLSFERKKAHKIKGFVAHFLFRNWLVDAISDYADDEIQVRELLGGKSKREARFLGVIKGSFPDIAERLNLEEAHIRFWLQIAKDLGSNAIKVLTARDDFLNDPDAWEGVPGAIVLEHGGHGGFMETKWFRKLLNLNYILLPSEVQSW